MANELSLTMAARYGKGGLSFNVTPPVFNVDITGSDVASGTQNVGTVAEALEKGDITTPGYLFVKNLDATNFIEVGYDDTGFKNVVKVSAGKSAIFELAQATPQVRANTAACNIAYWLWSA